jgi:hypothetical protein
MALEDHSKLCPSTVRGELSGPLEEKAYLVVQVEDVRFRRGPVLFNPACTGFRELLAHQMPMAPHIRIKKTSRSSIGFPLLKAYHSLIRWFASSEQAVSLQADRRSRMSI